MWEVWEEAEQNYKEVLKIGFGIILFKIARLASCIQLKNDGRIYLQKNSDSYYFW